MIKACNLKKSSIVEINGQPHQVKHIDVQTPSARGANTLYKVRLTNVTTGQKLDQTYKGNDTLEEMELERRAASYLYQDQEMYIFMDKENYEQYTLHENYLEGKVEWLIDGMEGYIALLLNGQIIGIELPATMDLEIVETAPGIKGATATNRNKPATLSNSIIVMVPEYLETGTMIRVNTESGKYMSRTKG